MSTLLNNQPIGECHVAYDFLFIGLGASNSLILLALLRQKILEGKRVAIVETEKKNKNDKTYCFWAGPDEPIVKDLASIISHQYHTIVVNQTLPQSIKYNQYYYIRSIDLYDFTLRSSVNAGIPVFRDQVEDVLCENGLCTVFSAKNRYVAEHVFDSRPPSPKLLGADDIYLHQSFHGFHIRCRGDVFQEHTFEMMNFNVEQSDFTQFIYILPFSPHEALVELTRFGSQKIDTDYAVATLEAFIKRDFGDYEIISKESGCIPMTTFINHHNTASGILNTGAAANLIKPSTGYGFKKMYAFSEKVSGRITKNNYDQFNQIALDSKTRFRFYDHLLLLILLHWPKHGKKIFAQLFKSQDILTIFSFLDEKTSLRQEVRIFASLPTAIFVRSLFAYSKKYTRYAVALSSVIIYFITSLYSSLLSEYISYGLVIAGLILVGIPHGALDHLLQNDRKVPMLRFLFKYLLIVALFFTLWQFYPLISLVIFVLYSSFHFGESEFKEAGASVASGIEKIKAFLLGFAILFFIIGTHLGESMDIISSIHGLEYLGLYRHAVLPYGFLISIASFMYIMFYSILQKRPSNWGLLLLLILGIKVPLLLSFALYFIIQHSCSAWKHLKSGLNMGSIELYKEALPYTLAATVLLGVFLSSGLAQVLNSEGLLAVFFVFLACISLPHSLLMHGFYSKSK